MSPTQLATVVTINERDYRYHLLSGNNVKRLLIINIIPEKIALWKSLDSIMKGNVK